MITISNQRLARFFFGTNTQKHRQTNIVLYLGFKRKLIYLYMVHMITIRLVSQVFIKDNGRGKQTIVYCKINTKPFLRVGNIF